MRRLTIVLAVIGLAVSVLALPATAGKGNRQIQVNVLLNTDITDANLAELGNFGRVRDTLTEIDAVFMQAREADLDAIRALPFVASVGADAERSAGPIDVWGDPDFAAGISTWDLDAINVTDPASVDRTTEFDGDGVYVAVLDTGLVSAWPLYLPAGQVATEYAISFGGGGAVAEVRGEPGHVSTQPDKWQRDTNSHGTHVASTILGYRIPLGGSWTYTNGVAPKAKVIPVKVLNNSGGGWSSAIAQGITYVADLKENELGDDPVVINMSLGGPMLDPVEQAAIDYAVERGVIIVASAGNSGTAGMGYPGAYPPVISVAASGWVGEWTGQRDDSSTADYYRKWWWNFDVDDPTDPEDFYITGFSSREKDGQDLDVAAPGSWVVGPYAVNQGQLSWFFLGGTSMASPHVAGIAALMAEKYPALAQTQAEGILVGSAIPFSYTDGEACRTVRGPSGANSEVCWGPDADGAGLATADAALAATP